jgi:hypothetical protein
VRGIWLQSTRNFPLVCGDMEFLETFNGWGVYSASNSNCDDDGW